MSEVDNDKVREALLEALHSENPEYSYEITDDCCLKFIKGEGFYESGVKLCCTKDGDTETEEFVFAAYIDCLADVFLYGEDILNNMCNEIQEYIQEFYS